MRRPKIRDFIDECEIPNYTVINLDSLDSVSYQNALNEYIDYLEGRLGNLMIKNEVTCQQNELLCKKVNDLNNTVQECLEEAERDYKTML